MLKEILQSNLINFSIVIIFLSYIWKKYNLSSFIKNKIDEITITISSSKTENAKKEKQLEEAHKKLFNADFEKEEILKQAKKSAELMSSKIKEDTLSEIKKIHDKKEKQLELYTKSQKEKLKKELAEISVQMAEDNIIQHLNEENHKKLIDEFIEKLDGTKK